MFKFWNKNFSFVSKKLNENYEIKFFSFLSKRDIKIMKYNFFVCIKKLYLNYYEINFCLFVSKNCILKLWNETFCFYQKVVFWNFGI